MLAEFFANHQHLFHPLWWNSSNQRRLWYSFFGAEIIAAADADDHGYDLNLPYDSIFTNNKMRHKLFIDSGGFFDTITTVHESREYRLKKTIAKICNAFEACELNGEN